MLEFQEFDQFGLWWLLKKDFPDKYDFVLSMFGEDGFLRLKSLLMGKLLERMWCHGDGLWQCEGGGG